MQQKSKFSEGRRKGRTVAHKRRSGQEGCEIEKWLLEYGFERELLPGGLLMLRIRGKHMEPRMMEGDCAVLDPLASVENGAYAAVSIEGGRAEIYKVLRQKGGTLLCPHNRRYAMRFFPPEQEARLRIFGRVVRLMRNL